MAAKTSITSGDVLKYSVLPGFIPRIIKLLGGFKHLAYFIAVTFNTLRIIPNGHPCLLAANHGKYSVLSVLRIAASNLTFDRKNLDKTTIFFVVIGGLVLLLIQFILLIAALFTSNAFAAAAYDGPNGGPTNIAGFFNNPNPAEDLAFRMLDLVFGVPDIFNSKNEGTTPFHTGLHALFEFYSFGVLLVGAFVIIYLATAIVLETAQSGIPFGERFNKAWAPVRLILFFGLLMPAVGGLNLAQYIVLQSARLGSNVATNAWLGFDEAVQGPYLAESAKLIAEPEAPNLSSLVTFMQLAKTCQLAEGAIRNKDIKAWAVFGDGDAVEIGGEGSVNINDLAVKANGGTLFIRFGERKTSVYASERGGVFPFCGELMLTIVDMAQPGATVLQQGYLDLISCFWSSKIGGGSMPTPEEYLGASNIEPDDRFSCGNLGSQTAQRAKAYNDQYRPNSDNPFPERKWIDAANKKDMMAAQTANYMKAKVEEARDAQVEGGDWLNDVAMQMGWAGAGIWFNKIAEQNGALTAAAYAKPDIHKIPYVMEYVRDEKLKEDSNTPYSALFTPNYASGMAVPFNEPQELYVLVVLNKLFGFWGIDRPTFTKGIPETYEGDMTGNIIIDVMNVFMGTRGLFDMCKNTDIHPLAQIATLGKGLVEHSIRAFALAAGTGIGGGLLGIVEKMGFKQVLFSATSFLVSFAGIGLILGFILYYVVPFMPFIYFFFAVMTWVKSIFEAMVGMPLWALAHLHIDGEGMPGDAATAGYYHILEIFLRPILILVGLLGGIAVFAAMVKVMNQIFYIVLSNLAGHYVGADTGCFAPPGVDVAPYTEEQFLSGTIDEFFYTVIYTIIVYLFAIPCFKLVDMIPDHVMTWLGAGISTFGSQDGDPAEGMMQYVSIGAASFGGGLQQGFGKAFSMFS